MIETKNLTKTFDNFTAVDSLNLKIEKGEFFGLLGPNGAGKTTTISLLSTLLLPTKGEILIDGQQLTRKRPDLKRKISVITQEYSMRQDMNMDEIMEYQGRLYFMPRKEIKARTEELLEFCDLIKFRKRTVRKLSGGMKRTDLMNQRAVQLGCILMMAARIADQMMPVTKGAESDSAIRTKTRSAFAFSSGVVRYALPMTPMAMAKARDRMTHVMAMCVDFFRSLASEIAMNLTRICGCPK